MQGQNKRAFPRFRTKSTVYASYPGGIASVRDLSLGGVLLRDSDPIRVGGLVRLCLHLEGKLSFCQGVVRRADPRGMGLQFTEIAKDDRRVLGNYLLEVALAEGRERLKATGVASDGQAARKILPGTGLAALLARRGLLTQQQLEAATLYQRLNGASARMLVRSGVISEGELLLHLQREYGLPVIDLATVEPTGEALDLLPRELALLHEALPVGVGASALTIAIADPSNFAGLQQVRARAHRELRPMLAPALALHRAIESSYDERAREAG